MADESKASDSVTIDEGFYSRQLLVLGREAMERMAKYSVLVYGLTGLGCEVAKNIILAGMQSVTLHDNTPVALSDLSSHFYLAESSVGKPRAASCVDRLRALNSQVRVQHWGEEVDAAAVAKFNLVILVDQSKATIERVSQQCHDAGVHVIATAASGLLGYTFTDFGEEHIIIDDNGEEPASGVAVHISNDTEGIVKLSEKDGDKHGLQDGDVVVFERVEGMEELNDQKPRTVKVVTSSSFSIGDTSAYGTYVRGGYYKQVKQPRKVAYKSFVESLADPEIIMDPMNFERPGHLMLLQRALWDFQAEHGRYPAPGNAAEAKAVVTAAEALLPEEERKEGFSEEEGKVMSILAAAACGNVNPMAAVFGGITAQEAFKGASGKYTPIKQWFLLDSAACLGATPADCEPTGSRYDGQIAVFGAEFQAKLLALNYFLVGSGALGCEFLKNFALMGVAAGEGSLLVTDMDNIEKSNLNRQFLFHMDDVGKMKSTAAAREAKTFNPAFNVTAVTDKMCPDSEDKYNDAFWGKLDGVCNALDNLEARLYIDSRCVNFGKPLLESGTLGTMGNNLTCIPKVTLNYGAGPRPTEHKFPVCVVHGFPYNIQHCLHWAKEHFDSMYKDRPTEVSSYLSDEDFMSYLDKQRSNKLQRLQVLHEMLSSEHRPSSFADCIKYAVLKFNQWYNIDIQNLLHQHPLDEVTDGTPYWSEKKRPPTPMTLNLDDELHFAFVRSTACLFARVFGLEEVTEVDAFKEALPGIEVPSFDPKHAKFVPANEEERKKHEEEVKQRADEEGEDMDTKCERLKKGIPDLARLGEGFTVTAINFEKDDPANQHMDFIFAAANLRARQYNIPETDLMAARKFVGDIIPAIATTTAICTGLVCLELAKLVGGRPKEAFCNNNFNLAVNSFTKFEVDECKKVTVGGHSFTLWDKVKMDSDCTVRELRAALQERFGWKTIGINSTGADPVSLWAGDMDSDEEDEDDEDLDTKVSELYADMKELDEGLQFLVVEVEIDMEDEEEGEEVELPYVHIKLAAE